MVAAMQSRLASPPRFQVLAALATSIRKSRVRPSYVVCVAAGFAIGLFRGDWAFPYIETAFGDPLDDIVLGLAGGVFAAIAWEVVNELRIAFSCRR
jgi:hypothetical protein